MRIPVLALVVVACGTEPAPVEEADLSRQARFEGSFLDEVITIYGTDGESCYSVGREIQCVTATGELPLRIGDPIPAPDELSLCARSSDGKLDSCRPIDTQDWYHCDGSIPGACDWLVAGCEKFGDGGGSCGDCKGEGDCCCYIEEG